VVCLLWAGLRAETSQPRRFDLGDLDKLVTLGDPQFSPSGQTVVLVVYRPNFNLTDAPNGIQQFAWKPDGGAIAYVTADDSPDQKSE
jgi:hypothetical protein